MNKKYLIIIVFAILAIIIALLLLIKNNNNQQVSKSPANKGNNGQISQLPASGFQNTEGQNEINVEKKVGNFFVTVVDAKVIPKSQAAPYINLPTSKDVLILDLLFLAGDNCQNGCQNSSSIGDYRLVGQDGFLKSTYGLYTTQWESAPFLNGNRPGARDLRTGEKAIVPAYFLIDDTDNGRYTFYYGGENSQSQTQFFNLKIAVN